MPKTIRSKSTKSAGVKSRGLRDRILFHLKYTRCKDWRTATDYDKEVSFAYAIRELAMSRWIATQRAYIDHDVKRVYYLSMEFLMGRLLENNIAALGQAGVARAALEQLGLSYDDLVKEEVDAGLGNGGLGRLAACFLDSLASLEYPGYGYGIRYEHGLFRQEFDNGWQRERPDDWLKFGNPWEMVRPEYSVPVLVYGRVEHLPGAGGRREPVWVGWQMFEGVPYDMPIIGFGVNTVNMLRLWSSRATESFRLDVFNQGEYVKAVEEKNWAETITKVLYPSDATYKGKELRLIQEYFLVTCTIRDVIRRYRKNHRSWDQFAARNAIQLNDTHPALAVAELMRYFVDETDLPWDKAWDLTTRTFAYTNHTVLPEALEKWPVPLLERVLPRHLQIIYEINTRFLNYARAEHQADDGAIARMSLIEESDPKQVRMANLAIVGSHSVNGVSALHTDLLRQQVVPDFVRMWPGKFNNKTNGITHRRWLQVCNPALAGLISEHIGDVWLRDPSALRKLERFAGRPAFQQAFMAIKRANKDRLSALVRERTGEWIDPTSLFDVQIKRLHEYKRQLLNAMHILALYHRVKADPRAPVVPRTFLFGAKAAPAYTTAKVIIKFINSLARVINHDRDVGGRYKVVFVPDYNVTLAESIIPAADLSEQISTAGKEASGTGNMKLSLNGALTIGTWDGANIEIAQEVGLENIFICGHRTHELEELRRSGYNPWDYYHRDAELRGVIDAMRENTLVPDEGPIFHDLHRILMEEGDAYFHLADFRSYVDTQAQVSRLYADSAEWARQAILNVARMGHFSSDRTIHEYAREIWRIKPQPVTLGQAGHEFDEVV